MEKQKTTSALLTGQSEEHVVMHPEIGVPVHKEIIPPLLSLKRKASNVGFDLKVVSGFRNFQRQLDIWNAKATGQRPLLDSKGLPIAFASLSPIQIIESILRWSALPGASRHHWGTDIDVIDQNAVPDGYKVQLTPQEVAKNGIFGPLHEWLDDALSEDGFFRPYQEDRGGISPERWHLSYAPLATRYLQEFKLEVLEAAIKKSQVALKDVVLKELPRIYKRYITNITPE